MTFQKIMVPFLKEDSGLAALVAAEVFAIRFKAHLDVVHMRPPMQISGYGGGYYPVAANYVQATIDALNERANQQAETLKKRFEEHCEKSDVELQIEAEHVGANSVTASWSDVDPRISYDFSKRGRIADMAVLAKTGADATPDEVELMEDLVFQSARPVLFAPTGKPAFTFPETIIVAWDGGREAARAMAAAMPILKEARSVVVASVGDIPAGGETAAAASAYLKLHGVQATAMAARLDKGDKAEDAFLTHAAKRDADLIVMGAYSHSRWRELIWGGFTRRLLHDSEIPLFMMH